jgi:hypothetical protein
VIAQVRFSAAEGRRWVRRASQGAALQTTEDHDIDMSLFTASRRSALAVLAGCILGLAGASSAHAATAVNPLGCAPTTELNTPLTSFGDHSLYALAPGGTFAGGAIGGWRLTNAALVAENEPFGVVGNDGSSLGLRANGVAISEPMCIDETFPNFRFFAKAAKVGKSPLTVTVLFMDAKGNIGSVKSGTYVAKTAGWNLVNPMAIGIDIHPTATNAAAPVAFQFASAKDGSWQIDDLLVDPYRRG